MKINRLKKLTAIAVSVMIALGALNLSPGLLPNTVYADGETSGTCGDNLTWSFDSSTGTLTISGDGEMEGYSSSSENPWYTYRSNIINVIFDGEITGIDNSAFASCSNLKSITIPDSVTSIGNYAFYYCTGLTNISIGNGVTSIGDWAFGYCHALTSINIPDSVKSIGDYAFNRCTGLTSLTIGNGVTSIGRYAFVSCPGLESITVDENNSVYHSANNCIIETERKKLILGCKSSVIPDDGSVTQIAVSAFDGCTKLTSINIPKNITRIENSAFTYCSGIDSISVDENNPVYHSSGNCLIETGSKTLIAGCKGSVIPDDGSVTSIGNYAFRGCTGLTSITIPESITNIGYGAFFDCSGLTTIAIPNSVSSIGAYAFERCTELTSITLPECITKIEYEMFAFCDELAEINIPDGVTSIGDRAFIQCFALKNITIPDKVSTIGSEAFAYSGLTSTVIPSSVTSIGADAFRTSHLTDIDYRGTEAQWNAINIAQGNEHLLSADIHFNPGGTCGENLTWSFDDSTGTLTISGYGDMYDYSDSLPPWNSYTYSIKRIVFDGEITSIGNSAFAQCTDLTSITIPDSVTSIGEGAFRLCSNLENITIPDGVTNIENEAFLFTGYYNTASNWEDGALYIGNHLININENLSKNYTVKEGTVSIASGVYLYYPGPNPGDVLAYCDWLESVTIPESVKSIGLGAFYGCSSLTDVNYAGTEAQWNNIAIEDYNEPLLKATKHFNYKPDVNHTIDYGGLDRGISDPIIINYTDSSLKLTVTALTPQENEGFNAPEYGCSMKFELAPAEDGAEVTTENPAEILVSKDYIGTNTDSIVIFQYVTNADGTRSRVSYTFSKNDSRYKITDNGDGYWRISVYTI